MIANGKYSDGLMLDSRPVVLEFTARDELLVRGDNLELGVPFSEVRISDRLGHVPRFIYLTGGAVIETGDNDGIDALLAGRRRAAGSRFIHFLENHTGIAVAATVALVILVAYIGYFGVPALSRQAAYRVPPSADAQIGRAALLAINNYMLPSHLEARDRARVKEQLKRLLPDRPERKLPRLEFRSMGAGNPNAFALPGNVIIVSDELVALATRDDEIAAVLAHELGHLEKRHGLQSILRSSTALLVVSTVTGDLSTLTSFSATLPLTLLQNGYSREFEHEADVYAHDLMLARGINLKYFASILKKLEGEHPANGRGHSYLSTHPATEDRIKLFQTAEPGDADEEWQTEDAVASKSSVDEIKTSLSKLSVPQAQDPVKEPALPQEVFISHYEGTVVQPAYNIEPSCLDAPTPVYPVKMKRAHIEGKVVITFVIDANGKVKKAAVSSSTRKEFEEPAMNVVNKSTFTPAKIGHMAIEATMRATIEFILEKNPPN